MVVNMNVCPLIWARMWQGTMMQAREGIEHGVTANCHDSRAAERHSFHHITERVLSIPSQAWVALSNRRMSRACVAYHSERRKLLTEAEAIAMLQGGGRRLGALELRCCGLQTDQGQNMFRFGQEGLCVALHHFWPDQLRQQAAALRRVWACARACRRSLPQLGVATLMEPPRVPKHLALHFLAHAPKLLSSDRLGVFDRL